MAASIPNFSAEYPLPLLPAMIFSLGAAVLVTPWQLNRVAVRFRAEIRGRKEVVGYGMIVGFSISGPVQFLHIQPKTDTIHRTEQKNHTRRARSMLPTIATSVPPGHSSQNPPICPNPSLAKWQAPEKVVHRSQALAPYMGILQMA